MDSDVFKGKPWDTDNIKDCFYKIDTNEYRYPGWFNGTISKMIDGLQADVFDNTFPFTVILEATCYINCSFKGLTSN